MHGDKMQDATRLACDVIEQAQQHLSETIEGWEAYPPYAKATLIACFVQQVTAHFSGTYLGETIDSLSETIDGLGRCVAEAIFDVSRELKNHGDRNHDGLIAISNVADALSNTLDVHVMTHDEQQAMLGALRGGEQPTNGAEL